MRRLLFMPGFRFAQPASADDGKNHEFLYGYLAGAYQVIGQEIDSDRTYEGKVILKHTGDQLEVIRMINSERVTGIGKIEHALGPDEANVLRVRFKQNGKKYEITYIWQSDLDNYARLSGYVYQPEMHTSNPGLEALFIEHRSK